MNASARRGPLDRAGVFHADGERLFHHHVNAARRGGFDDGGVIVGVGEGGDRFRFGLVEQRRQIGEHLPVVQAVPLGERGAQRGIGIVDADDLEVRAILEPPHEPVDVAVRHAGDRELQLRRIAGGRRRGGSRRESASIPRP